jgi:hypothetical protein
VGEHLVGAVQLLRARVDTRLELVVRRAQRLLAGLTLRCIALNAAPRSASSSVPAISMGCSPSPSAMCVAASRSRDTRPVTERANRPIHTASTARPSAEVAMKSTRS